jgi:hypothetical protein
VLLPDKHITISESLLGLAALILTVLEESMSFDSLLAKVAKEFETPSWPAFHNAESVCLALCFLHSIGVVDVESNGDLFRCV